MQEALRGVADLRSQIKSLTRENSRLKNDLERLYDAEDVSIQPTPGKKGNAKSVQTLTSQVNKFKREVIQLEEVCEPMLVSSLLLLNPSYRPGERTRKKLKGYASYPFRKMCLP